MRFTDPWMLLLWLLIPLAVYAADKFRESLHGSLRFSDVHLMEGAEPSLRLRLSQKLIYLRVAALFLVVLAAARPQAVLEKTRINVEGIDIVLALDVSSSMRAMDFEMSGRRVDRLAVVKTVVSDFIRRRPNDKIGMVAFSALAYTISPLTLDHDWLESNLERARIGMIKDGTAIGSAIAASLNRIKDSVAKEKIIILLTDGRNNAGRISPVAAAEAAAALKVKVYTIGAGTKGLAPYPVKDMFGDTVLQPVEIEIDEELLEKIAQTTGAEYYRATDTRSLENIYERIDKLEKTPIEETGYNLYRELFAFALVPGLFLILLEIILSNTFLRRIP